MSIQNETVGVVLMTYGSATTADGVRSYFEHIYGGKAPEKLVADFENRYRLVGRSPLVEITLKQAELLEAKLGKRFVVRAGMLHSAPWIESAAAACRDAGAKRLLGIILSPQFSRVIMGKYERALAIAAQQFSLDATIVPPWPTEPHFIKLLVEHINHKLETLGPLPVVFTTHSLPKRVVEKDTQYLEQLRMTVDAVLAILDRSIEWYAAYQSAGHTPEEWLKPDLTDILAELKGKTSAILVVPIQFLADHLEILYDLDIAAAAQCADVNISYHRIDLPNTNPLFITSLASLTRLTVRNK